MKVQCKFLNYNFYIKVPILNSNQDCHRLELIQAKQVVYYYKIIFLNGMKCDETGLLHEGNTWQPYERTNGKMVHKKPQVWGGVKGQNGN